MAIYINISIMIIRYRIRILLLYKYLAIYDQILILTNRNTTSLEANNYNIQIETHHSVHCIYI